MIVEASAKDIASLPPTSEAAVRILAQYQAYGCGQPFLQFWTCSDGGILSLMDGTSLVALPDNKKSAEQAALFLHMHPDVTTVRTDGQTAATIAKAWGTGRLTTGVVMTPGSQDALLKHPDNTEQSVYAPPLRQVYQLLATVFGEALPTFEVWYTDVHHRLRHRCCRIKAVEQGGQPVSAAMTVAECSTAAVIGAVATSPQHRGKGYAAICVTALAGELLREGKRVLLSPKNDYARQLYESWGFTVCESWGTVTRLP